MALKPLNSVGGFSVGETPANVIDSNLNFTGNTANFTGNLVSANANLGNLAIVNFVQGTLTTAAQPNITSVGNLSSLTVGNATANMVFSDGLLTTTGNISVLGIKTDNYYLANGTPVDFQQTGGSNTQVQFNNAGNFGGSANFTFDSSTNVLTVTGNANVTNTLLTPNVNSGTGNLTLTANGFSTVIDNTGNVTFSADAVITAKTFKGNVEGNISGNITAPGANTNIIYNNAGLLAGSNAFAFDNTTNTVTISNALSVTGNASAGNLSTGGVLSVTGNANVGNLGTAGLITATGNVSGGNLTTGGVVSATGNVTGGNLTTGGVVSATGNVTGGNLTTAGALSVTGNANVGNLGTATLIATTGNITTINSGLLQNGNSNIAITANGNISMTAAGGTVEFVITSTGVNVAGTLNATGNANVGNLGTAQVLASANVTAPQLISNVTTGTAPLVVTSTTAVANLRAATSNVANTVNDAAQPNITSVGTLTSLAVTGNANVGNINAAVANLTGDLIVAGNANIGNGSGGTISGANLVSANFLTGTLTTAAQPNITSVGNLTSLVVTGNLTAGNIIGALANGNSSVSIPAANGNVNISAVGNANILVVTGTGVNVAGTLNATGNANAGNLGTGRVIATGNISGTQLISNIANGTAPLVVTSTTVVANLRAEFSNVATVAGTVSVNAQPNITSVGTLTGLSVTGSNITLTSGAYVGNGAGLTDLAGANVTGQVANALVAGTVYTNAQPNITSVGTLSNLTIAGNGNIALSGAASQLSGANLVSANFLTGTLTTSAQPNITSVGTLTALSVDGANITLTNGVYVGNGAGLTALAGANVTGQVANALVAGTVYTNAQPNITSVGNLSSLTVTGNIGAGNINAGNLLVANFLQGDGHLLSNINVANIGTVANANYAAFAGNVVTASQPNITSVGNLSSLVVTGNVNAGGNLVTSLIVANGNSISISAAGSDQNVTLAPTGTGVVDVSGKKVANLATPTNATDAATKQYVDDVAQGLHVHASCNAATTGTLATISGGTVTYDNGTAGVGATLTTTGTYTTIDGVTLSDGMRILVKNEVAPANNGIYVRTSATVLTRATDFDTGAEIQGGDFTFVTAGTQYNSTGWVQVDEVTTVGTDPIEWLQFSGAGEYTAGTGLTLTGGVFSITNTTVTAASYGNGDSVATFTVNAQGQLTAAANVAITANAANLSGTVLNANIVTSSLTSVGTLGSLAVTGNATAGNVYANSGTIGASILTGNLSTAAQPNITSVGTLTSLDVTGTASAGNLSTGGNLAVTGNAAITANLTAGNANIAGNLVAGNISTTGNISGANVISANTLSGNLTGTTANLSGNVTGSQLISSIANGTAPIVVTSQTLVANLNANLLNGYVQDSANTANTIALRNADGNLSANYFIGNGAFLTGIDTSLIANGNSSVSIPAAAGNVNISVNGTANTAVFTTTGLNLTGNLLANVVKANTLVEVGNTTIRQATVTTSAVTANQAISSVAVSGITGVEWLVRGVDSSGTKYSVATVVAVTNGSDAVDYSVFGTVNLGTTTGTLAVNIANGNLQLQVTPSTTNPTVWVTQYRTI
jgi:hypothetical protein